MSSVRLAFATDGNIDAAFRRAPEIMVRALDSAQDHAALELAGR